MIQISLIFNILLILFIIYLIFKIRDNSLIIETKGKESDYINKARDNLLRSVNHELRAPLSRMSLDVEMMEESKTKSSLSKDIQFMNSLIEELMEIEKIKIGNFDNTDLNLTKLTNDITDILRIETDELITDIEDNIILKCNQSLIEKLFKNIIENAQKYKSSEGKIRISLKIENDLIVFSVMNEGSFIPSSDLPFLFEPFYRVDKSRTPGKTGFGLGLNICKEITSLYGGNIKVSTKEGLGTTFKTTLKKQTN